MRIPQSARKMVEEWRLGFVATVSPEGTPNVSPKGTFLVLDDETIAFGEMRSPNTMRNLAHQPEIEVSFVDTLSRKGVRFRGRVRIARKGDAEFERLRPNFEAVWGGLCDLFNAIVVIPAAEVKAFASPIYEVGADEQTLRQDWKKRIEQM